MSTTEGPPSKTARAIDPGPNQDTQGTTGRISESLAENVVTAQGPSFPSTLSSVPSNITGREDDNTEPTNLVESPPGQNTGRGTSIRFGTIGEDEEDGASVQTYEHEQVFLTAPAGSESPEEGPSSRPLKGKERARFVPSQEYSPTWDDATESSHHDNNRSDSEAINSGH
ncbi:hypothetical protein BC826DRAFT_975040 [Russula brevipes]|nr:hypothetical protein BC826DRAFT_975040 [Russula brevipes]